MAAGPAASAAAPSGTGDCIAHHPTVSGEYQIGYTGECTGHDEPELDPVSSLPGSAQDLTWTAVLPQDGTVPVSAVGPTFWWGGTVTDPNLQSLSGQAFLEVDGGFNVTYAPDKFSVCSPVWHGRARNSRLRCNAVARLARIPPTATPCYSQPHSGRYRTGERQGAGVHRAADTPLRDCRECRFLLRRATLGLILAG